MRTRPWEIPYALRGWDTVRLVVEELPWLHLDRFGEPPSCRDLGIAFPSLDPAHLCGVNAAALRNLFLCQFKPLAGFPQIGAEIGHAAILCPIDRDLHRVFHK